MNTEDNDNNVVAKNKDTATFGSGCFWCTEAVFQQVNGVDTVISGYSGGHVVNPSYKQVCTATTGHAEVLQIVFNPSIVSYSELLKMFWYSHDPTTLNRQGNDSGEQYRSVIFYGDDEQRQVAESTIAELTAEKAFPDPIVTAVEPAEEFHVAEDYHQNYYNENSRQPYCMFVISPKLEKLEKKFAEKLRA